MTKNEREYLDRLKKGFMLKVSDTRETLKFCTPPSELERLELYADTMDICAVLIRKIRSDFEKLEKEGVSIDEQKNSQLLPNRSKVEEPAVPCEG